ncbi:hypothetical protein [Photobacterium piscicola]|uniref:hypothetical protein n=1 Tax=Photobacterium piscicola TaxID=1378299 RepID=UPI001B30AB68|nr:hypothetical protein [Photobacterium piscicola]
MLDIGKLKKAYQRYGFEVQPNLDENVAIFSIRTGHYHNADIIPLKNNVDASRVLKEFQDLGYACQTKQYQSVDEVETAII